MFLGFLQRSQRRENRHRLLNWCRIARAGTRLSWRVSSTQWRLSSTAWGRGLRDRDAVLEVLPRRRCRRRVAHPHEVVTALGIRAVLSAWRWRWSWEPGARFRDVLHKPFFHHWCWCASRALIALATRATEEPFPAAIAHDRRAALTERPIEMLAHALPDVAMSQVWGACNNRSLPITWTPKNTTRGLLWQVFSDQSLRCRTRRETIVQYSSIGLSLSASAPTSKK